MSIESLGVPGHLHRLAEGEPHPDHLAQQVGRVAARIRDHLHPGHRRRSGRRRRLRRRRDPPVHLVVRIVAEPGMAERRVRLRRRRADRRPAARVQRVAEHRDPLPREVRLHHLVDEHQRVRAGAALVDRALLAPLGRVHVDRDPRRARHRHRLVERDPHPDPLAEAVGGVAAGVRDHRDAGHRRRVRLPGARRARVPERRGEPAARAQIDPPSRRRLLPASAARAHGPSPWPSV